jgi:hypothetical protein
MWIRKLTILLIIGPRLFTHVIVGDLNFQVKFLNKVYHGFSKGKVRKDNKDTVGNEENESAEGNVSMKCRL